MKEQQRTLLAGGALLLLSLFLFVPPLLQLAKETVQHEQLRHALLILLFATAAMLIQERKKLSIRITPDKWFYLWISLSFLFIAAAHFRAPLFFTASAFALALVAWLGFLYGKESRRLSIALALAFVFFIVAAQAFEVFDWPLRQMAGSHSAWVLNHFGLDSSLFLDTAEGPRLILRVDQRPFEVASECNGYGLISSSALVALLLVAYRRLAWPDKVLSFALAVFLGSLFNTLRILLIVLLAPQVGNSYLLMHESVGTLFFWSCLVLVWLIIGGFPEKKKSDSFESVPQTPYPGV